MRICDLGSRLIWCSEAVKQRCLGSKTVSVSLCCVPVHVVSWWSDAGARVGVRVGVGVGVGVRVGVRGGGVPYPS